MRTKAENFHSMLGHVAEGCEIIHNDRLFTLHNRMRGWVIYDDTGAAVSDEMHSAYAVENFVINILPNMIDKNV